MMPFWELTLHLSNRSLPSWFSGDNSIGDAGASVLGASLTSSLQVLGLSECFGLLFGALSPPPW